MNSVFAEVEAWLEKRADVETSLRPHQTRVVERLRDRPGLVVIHGLGSGKCVRGTTPIWTRSGVAPISSLFPDSPACGEEWLDPAIPVEVASYQGGEVTWVPVTRLFRQELPPTERTLLVETERGSRVECTAAHKVWVVRDGRALFVSAGELLPGEFVGVAASLPEASSTSRWSEDEVFLLSWQIAEGWESAKKADTIITQKDPQVLYSLQEAYLRLGYTHANTAPGQSGQSGHIRAAHEGTNALHISSREYQHSLTSRGYIWGHKSATKSLPPGFLAGGSQRVKAVIGAFIDAEGSVSLKTGTVEISSASRELLTQLQYGLMSLGVRTACHPKMGRATNGARILRQYWRLAISGEDTPALTEVLGDYSVKVATLRGRDVTVNPNFGVPIQWHLDALRELGVLKALGLALAPKKSCSAHTCLTLAEKIEWLVSPEGEADYLYRSTRYGGTAGAFSARTLAVIREHRRVLQEIATSIRTLVSMPLRWEPIAHVALGEAGGVVYDLSVGATGGDTQNYIAGIGGLVVHNTLTSIAAAEDFGQDTTVVLPASLQENYRKEMARHIGAPRARYALESVQRAASTNRIPKGDLLIVDEAHRLRDPGSKSREVVEREARKFQKRMLLSATPVYNHPADLASLVNLASGSQLLPDSRKEFEAQYYKRETVNPGFINRWFRGIQPGETVSLRADKGLKDALRDWVDYHANSTEGFPTRIDEVVEVPMSSRQEEVYRSLMEQAPPSLRGKVREGLPPSKKEVNDLNAFLSGMRQVSNSPRPYVQGMTAQEELENAPKIREAFRRFVTSLQENPQHKAVVYSNYIAAGLDPYARLLEQEGIPYGTFTGSVPKAVRDDTIRAYNRGDIKALLVSSAGAEGLDLKGTRQIQTLEPHWNEGKTDQVAGRGIRYGSHADLPEDQRNVRVETYLSVLPKPTGFRARWPFRKPPETSSDQYLRQMGGRKRAMERAMADLMQEATDEVSAQMRRAPSAG